MPKVTWKVIITKCCKSAGTYDERYVPVIDALAKILEERDRAIKSFEAEGGEFVVVRTNTKGADNEELNPYVNIIKGYHALALSYWNELGLTPKGFKALGESAVSSGSKKKLRLEDILAQTGKK